uniref:IS66 family transposase n=1 Tax=Hallella sp. TaxID=2980186 RepID=UPI00307A2CF2
MKTAPTYDELRQEVIRLKERVAYLERLLYGAKSDKLLSKVPEDQPSLFDDLFKEALDKKASEIEQAKKEIEKEVQERQAK